MFDESSQINGFLGIASDISELQQATRALQKSESRFRGLVANLPGVVYRCANDADWSMRYISDEIANLSGYPASDFIDNQVRSFSSIVHPDDLAITYRIGEAIARQESFELTYRLRHADGHNVWVREKGRGEYDSHGRLLWVDGFIWDISERQAMEDELRLSQQRFLNAFNTAPQGMALVSPDGRWLEVNDELCRMLGYDREELLACPCVAVRPTSNGLPIAKTISPTRKLLLSATVTAGNASSGSILRIATSVFLSEPTKVATYSTPSLKRTRISSAARPRCT